MSFNSQNYYTLREEFLQKHLAAAERAEARKQELAGKIPELADIDGALASTASRILGAAFAGKAGLEERIADIRKETEQLREARAALLKAYGYPADYTDVKYDCPHCKDLGFVDTKMCDCLRRALIFKGYETSGLGALIGKQTFDNYSLDFFKADSANYQRMQQNVAMIRSFAENFKPSCDSLLFMGGTGLGKTHLSSAVAKTVIDRGYDVLYTSAVNMFSEFEKAKFRGEQDETHRYFTAELLIIDDLGTEMANTFTDSCLYNIIDTRICKGMPTVISTNLGAKELSARYGERIFSRLLGVYKPLLFVGKDVRFERG